MTLADIEAELASQRARNDELRAEVARLSAIDADRRKRSGWIAWIAFGLGCALNVVTAAAAFAHDPLFSSQGAALLLGAIALLFVGFSGFVAAYPRPPTVQSS